MYTLQRLLVSILFLRKGIFQQFISFLLKNICYGCTFEVPLGEMFFFCFFLPLSARDVNHCI